MHCGHFFEFWIWHVEVQRLRLANEGASCGSKINQASLWNLPNSLVEFFDMIWYLLDIQHGSIVSYKLILDIFRPQIDLDQIFNQMLVDTNKLTCQYSPCVHICSERLEAFIITENL